MDALFETYDTQLNQAGLCGKGEPLLGFLDAELVWNKTDPACDVLTEVFHALNINSLLFAHPKEPYRTILSYLTKSNPARIYPKDCETRTFLHDLPVIDRFAAPAIISVLRSRKSVIIPGKGIVTWGTVSLEQAYVTFSSVCFALFVKFFSDYLHALRHGKVDNEGKRVFKTVSKMLPPFPVFNGNLLQGPFDSDAKVHTAMDEAGKLTVACGLVDSYFGNISYLQDNILHISQSGSSLDRLLGMIDPCPMDGSSCAGMTASSELAAHMEIISKTGHRAILHGHPKFSVIMSMDCTVDTCDCNTHCHQKCHYSRHTSGIPIVSGEVGTGTHGLCHTVPPAIIDQKGVIVYGHGVFTTGSHDFNQPFSNLLAIEIACREAYFDCVADLS